MENNSLSPEIKKMKDLPRIKVIPFDTPLHRMKNFENDLKYSDGIYIKRDDLSGIGPGGNKNRTLEYSLAEAKEKGCDTIITSGPPQSNLCAQVAAASLNQRLKPVLVFNTAKPDLYRGNLLLDAILGADMIFAGSVDEEKALAAVSDEVIDKIIAEYKSKGKKPYLIAHGGSAGIGIIGYAHVPFEILRQMQREHFSIREIYLPGGNGGMASGVILGNYLLGSPFMIRVISVEFPYDKLYANIQTSINYLIDRVGFDFSFEDIGSYDINDDYRGEGWNINTEASTQMVYDFARTEGIFIENTYTSKTVVGMVDFIKKGKAKGGVCYLHSGGIGALYAQKFAFNE